jgi:hypothetical protein
MSGKISDIWPRKISSPVETETNPGSLLTLKLSLSSLEVEVHGDPNLPKEISCAHILDGYNRTFEGPERWSQTISWRSLRSIIPI